MTYLSFLFSEFGTLAKSYLVSNLIWIKDLTQYKNSPKWRLYTDYKIRLQYL